MPTFTTSQAVLDRIGPYANSTIMASEAIIDRYIDSAEQTIVAETRRNWITSSASVSDPVKQTLKLCAACHAAVEIVQDDMSGFSTRAEAITMLDVNEMHFQRTLKALKDADILDIRGLSD